jgi:hypothetical protein
MKKNETYYNASNNNNNNNNGNLSDSNPEDSRRSFYSALEEKYKVPLETINSIEEIKNLRKRYGAIKNSYIVKQVTQ